jgi:hypothetical protein
MVPKGAIESIMADGWEAKIEILVYIYAVLVANYLLLLFAHRRNRGKCLCCLG